MPAKNPARKQRNDNEPAERVARTTMSYGSSMLMLCYPPLLEAVVVTPSLSVDDHNYPMTFATAVRQPARSASRAVADSVGSTPWSLCHDTANSSVRP